MGGRGSRSGAKGGGISKASEARSFYELKSYMESQGGRPPREGVD